jgi:hypothetical protein
MHPNQYLVHWSHPRPIQASPISEARVQAHIVRESKVAALTQYCDYLSRIGSKWKEIFSIAVEIWNK